MPIVFAVAGLLLIVSGVRGTVTSSDPSKPSLVALVKSDFTGQPNYFEWVLAIVLIGAIGYIPKMEPVSRAFMALVIVGMLLSNRGFFAQLKSLSQQSALTTQPTGASNNALQLQPLGTQGTPAVPPTVEN
jgi:hypothetical protein